MKEIILRRTASKGAPLPRPARSFSGRSEAFAARLRNGVRGADKRCRVQSGVVAVVAGALLCLALSAEAAQAFRVFDGTLYTHKPDLRPYGVETAHVIYGSAIFKRDTPRFGLPTRGAIERLAQESVGKGKIVVLDIERWRPDGAALLDPRKSGAAIQKAVRRYVTVARWFRQAGPHLPFGFFGTFPIAGDRRIRLPSNARGFRQWESDNVGLRPIADSVDIIYPECYAGNGDFARWAGETERLITAARLYGKPVYVFLWPVYAGHDPDFGGQRMSAAMWRRELDFVASRADGVVIWGGWDFRAGRRARWNPTATWWVATKEFLCAKNLVEVSSVCGISSSRASRPVTPSPPALSVSGE